MNALRFVFLAVFLSFAIGPLAGCEVVPAGPVPYVAAAPVYVAPAPIYVGPAYWHGGCCYTHWRR